MAGTWGGREPCPGFQPKRTDGPLRSWCCLCGHHLADHMGVGVNPRSLNVHSEPHSADSSPERAPPRGRRWGKSKAKPSEADAGRAKSGGVASLVAVFDFDRTLTSVHAGPFDLGPDVVNRLFGGAQRFEAVTTMLKELHSKGVELHICTFNSSRVVSAALGPELAGLMHTIAGNETFRGSKAAHIASQIMQGRSESGLIFVDDDPYNVEEVAKELPGCQVRFVAGEFGMDQGDLKFVSTWLKKKHK